MRLLSTFQLRKAALTMLAVGGLLAWAAPVCAQGFGIGGRISWLTRDLDDDVDVDIDEEAQRFFGGQIRLIGGNYGFEVSLDRRSESFDLLNQKVTETPIQMSLLLRMASGKVAPFLLGGPGWYRRKVEPIEGPDVSVSTTEFGWHAGGGLEVLPSRHFGIHGDYRYTFIDFDDDDDEGFIGGLLPGHKGSMWTLGATFYF